MDIGEGGAGYFLHPKLKKIHAVLITPQLIPFTLRYPAARRGHSPNPGPTATGPLRVTLNTACRTLVRVGTAGRTRISALSSGYCAPQGTSTSNGNNAVLTLRHIFPCDPFFPADKSNHVNPGGIGLFFSDAYWLPAAWHAR